MQEYVEAKKRHEWITFNQDPWMSVVGKDLYTKKLGLIGDGAIAVEIGKRAKAFEMEVYTYGLYNKDCTGIISVIQRKGLIRCLRNVITSSL